MGTLIFDFLADSFLFHEDLLGSHYASVSDADLRAELTRYREYCLNRLPELEKEIPAEEKSLVVFAGTESIPLDQLKQSAFYIETYILNDPVFSLTSIPNHVGQTFNEYIGLESHGEDRPRLAQAVRYVKSLTPMVAANYVKFLPVSLLFEPPNKIPLLYSNTSFGDILPPPLTFLHERAIVRSLERVENGWQILDDLTPCRGITIGFRGHKSPGDFIFHLLESEGVELDEAQREFISALSIPDTPRTKTTSMLGSSSRSIQRQENCTTRP